MALAELEAALAHCAAPAKERAAGDPGNSQSTKSSSSAVETISVIATAEMIVKPPRSRQDPAASLHPACMACFLLQTLYASCLGSGYQQRCSQQLV